MDAIKNWPKPKSIRNIWVFLHFVNLYQCFIWGFTKIAGPLMSMLKISLTLVTQSSMNLVKNFINILRIQGYNQSGFSNFRR